MNLAAYADKLRLLNVLVARGRASPHKICMLLAVFDLARSGALSQNRIEFAPALLERYAEYFNAVRTDKDHANPYFPFFHLQGNLRGGATSFWHLQARPGREMVLATMKTATSARQISDNVDCAWLDEELFDLLQNPDAADVLAAVLAETWFGRGLNDLDAVARKAKAISCYERRLRNPAAIPPAAKEDTPAYVRDPAFRRVVTEIYDYRCAASGLRLVLDDGTPLVEAAHIHPFSEAGDDDPRNGLALTPNMHWAMDRWLIAPDTEFRWRVSRVLDKRVPDHRMLAELEGKKLFLPREARMYPKREAIEWRLGQLAK